MKTALTVVLLAATAAGGILWIRITTRIEDARHTPKLMRLYNQELPDTGHAQRLVP